MRPTEVLTVNERQIIGHLDVDKDRRRLVEGGPEWLRDLVLFKTSGPHTEAKIAHRRSLLSVTIIGTRPFASQIDPNDFTWTR